MTAPKPVWLSFDCFGTLIDWERGIINALSPVFLREERTLPYTAVMTAYAELERDAERPPFRPYRQVLREVMCGLAARFGLRLERGEENLLVRALPHYPPFPDSRPVLGRLAGRFRLAVLSNVDRDLFEPVLDALGRPFACVLTADAIGAYKPDPQCFRALLEACGAAPVDILHCAQSRFHDVAPARAAGIPTMWIRRRQASGKAVPASDATADYEVESLDALAEWLGVAA